MPNGESFQQVSERATRAQQVLGDFGRRKNGQPTNLVERSLPLGRLGTPEEVAGIVVFLSSEEVGYVNGTSIPADGGESRSF
jgi:NAD(P)-dependent dehydrogenase (short-subunit alcohol dehydrogenase family)